MAANNKKNKSKSTNKGVWLWPIAIALGVIPLLVHTHDYDTSLSQFDWYPDGIGEQTDFFLYFKMIGLIIMSAVMLCILLYRLSKDRKNMPWQKPFFLMVGYVALCFISFLFSKYKGFAAAGGYEIFEPVWVVVGYVVIMYYCYSTISDDMDIVKLFSVASIGIAIVYIIGVFQFAGLDFFKSDFGKRLILSDAFWAVKDQISFTFPDNYIYSTLYNINFVGMFVGALLPVFLVLIFVDTKVWRRFIWGAFVLATPIMIYGSHTDSSYVAIAAGVVVAGLVIAWRKKIVGIIASAVVLLGVVGAIIYFFSPAATGLRNQVLGEQTMSEMYPLTNVLTKDDGIEMSTNNETIKLSWDDENLTIADSNGSILDTEMTQTDNIKTYTIVSDGDFKDAVCNLEVGTMYDETTEIYQPYRILAVDVFGSEWVFDNQINDGQYMYYNGVGKWVRIDERPYVDAFNPMFLSGRGIVWNHMLPALKKTIIIGSGANTYITATAQDDYIWEVYFNALTTYDVKGHNWFFHTAVEEGVLAVLLFIAFYIWYAIQSIKLFLRGKLKDKMTWIVLAFFIGTVIYYTAALANDSTVCTGIVVWVILGVGLAANRIAEESQKRCLEEEQSN